MRSRGWARLVILSLFLISGPIRALGQESPSPEEEDPTPQLDERLDPHPDEQSDKRLAERLGLTGSIRGGFWTSFRTLDDKKNIPTGALWLKAAPDLGPRLGAHGSLHFEGWVGRLSEDAEVDGRLREGYLDLSAGPIDLRIGRQIIVWGRADRINPTDNLTPRDFTLLVPEDDDQRLGVFALKATYFVGPISMTALWLPHFEPDRVPLGPAPPPLSISEERPDRGYRQGAFKIERTGGAVDGSLSYFHGFDPFPDIAIDLTHLPSVNLALEHHKIDVVGADAAATVGRFGLRAEAAYTFTEDKRGNDPEVKNPFFFLVAGGDRTFLEYLNINLQYIFRMVARYRDPEEIPNPLLREVAIQQAVITNQIDRVQQGISLRISDQWFNQTLEGEAVGIIFLPRHDYAVRPKVAYAFTDRWKGVVGADLFRGEDRSFFGYLKKNTTAYAELRWSF